MIAEALSYPFFQRALIAGLLASVACGVMGSLVVVRKISSIAGGLSHAAFGGVGLGYLFGFDPMIGALGFGVASAAGLGAAELRMRQGLDTLISMVWAVGMALGIVFVSLAPGQAPDLLGFLFGNILLVSPGYLVLVAALDLLVILVVFVLFRQLRAICFDEEFSWVVGVPVAPLFLLIGIGAVCIAGGLFLTYSLSARYALDLPTGPAIILLAALLFGLSYATRAIGHRSA